MRARVDLDDKEAVYALARVHGVRTIYTRDRDVRKFPFLRVVDPFA